MCVQAFVYVSMCVNQQDHNGIKQSAFGQAGARELFNPEESADCREQGVTKNVDYRFEHVLLLLTTKTIKTIY